MSRSYRRAFQLAQLSDRDVNDVIRILQGGGVPVTSENDLVPLRRLPEALRLLGLPAIPVRKVKVAEPQAIIPAVAEVSDVADVGARDLAEVEDGDATAVQPEATVGGSSRGAHTKRKRVELQVIGHRVGTMALLSADDVEKLHFILVHDFVRSKDPIDPPGIRSQSLLESAVGRVHTSLGGEPKYPTIPMAAAAYLHALTLNHPFHNGNKRTALVAMIVFLDLNDYLLEADQDELYDFVLKVAAHDLITRSGDERPLSDEEMNEIARWVHRRCRPISREEKVLKFHQLRRILLSYECEFEPLRGNRMAIVRGDRRTIVGYRNEGMDVDRSQIKELRAELGLTEEHGYDSLIFYNTEERVPEFIRKYRRTLNRLAKV